MAEQPLSEESIFLDAIDIESGSDRRAFLDEACGHNERMRAAVEGLLRAHEKSGDLLDLDDALSKLASVRPQAAELVRLRVFAGLTSEEAAAVVGISTRTARRLWLYARAWLRREVDAGTERSF